MFFNLNHFFVALADQNAAYNVDGLCHELPVRVQALFDAEGGKVAK